MSKSRQRLSSVRLPRLGGSPVHAAHLGMQDNFYSVGFPFVEVIRTSLRENAKGVELPLSGYRLLERDRGSAMDGN